jgi:hypothetical protein
MNKAIYDKAVPTRNLVTTILGIIGFLASVLVGFGVIDVTQSTEVVNQGTIIVNAIAGIYGAVLSLISVFKAKD